MGLLEKLAKMMTSESRLVIADGFMTDQIEKHKSEFEKWFEIESQVDISYGVRSSRYLGIDRQNKMVSRILTNYNCVKWFGKLLYSLLPEELQDKQKAETQPEYYSLRPGYIFYNQLDCN